MAFSEGDKAIIEETAWRVGSKIADEIKADTRIQVRLHASECPLKSQASFLAGGWKVLAVLAALLSGLAGMALHIWPRK